jgi:hypothetical protein
MLQPHKNDAETETMLKRPKATKQTNEFEHALLHRPVRTRKFVQALPEAEASGYMTVPLQGTLSQ